MALVNLMVTPAGRALRVAAGIALIVVGLLAIEGAAGIGVATIGLVPIVAGLLNLCLIGPLFGADIWGHPRGGSRPSAA